MTCKKWDIVLLPFPFNDLQAVKKRPGLVISPDKHNKSEQDIVIVFMTSMINSEKRIGDYSITNWQESGLPKPALLRMQSVETVMPEPTYPMPWFEAGWEDSFKSTPDTS